MKIGPLESKPVAAPTAAERTGQVGALPQKAEASTQVDLSPAASMLSSADGDGSFDAAKVDRIAGAIRNGQFTVNAEAIADKLIVNAEELLGRKFS